MKNKDTLCENQKPHYWYMRKRQSLSCKHFAVASLGGGLGTKDTDVCADQAHYRQVLGIPTPSGHQDA